MANEREEDRNTKLFTQLIFAFHTQAMVDMGKLVNPMTGKVEKNLTRAQEHIDMLAMLKEKTKGNLTPREEVLLDTTLTNLRLNFVEEVRLETEKSKKKEEKVKKEEVKVNKKATNSEKKESKSK